MKKTECLDRVARCEHAAKVATESAALFLVTFGSNDQLTQKAFLDRDIAIEAAGKWRNLASLHPKTRDSMIRSETLPLFMFGY
jgi:hypothetical protein